LTSISLVDHKLAEVYDVAIVGGGIVGLAAARALSERFHGIRVAVLEKESKVGRHQTGHNSGVIHCGIYYRPGSYKARLSVEGARLMLELCESRGLLFEKTGKVIVATDEDELPRLDALLARGRENGVPGISTLDPKQLREIEPHATGLRAIHCASTAIVDFAAVAELFARELEASGGELMLGAEVEAIERRGGETMLHTRSGTLRCRALVNCAGLHSDRIARLAGARPDVRIVPFRGEYYVLRPERRGLVRGLIYPVPDPDLPFLGVHFTRTVHGQVEAGPNAVLALAREGYSKQDLDPREIASFCNLAFLRMAKRHWRVGVAEVYRSLSKQAFVTSLQKLVPEIRTEDVEPGGSGVRAQAVDDDGKLVDDFRIVAGEGAVHVLNAPSPAATASIAIGRHIAEVASKTFGLA